MPMTKLPTFSTFPTQQGDLLPKSLRSRTPALLWMCLLFRHCLQPQRRLEEEESQDTLASEPFLLIFFSPIFLARLGEAHVWFLLNERVLMKPLPRYWKIRVFFKKLKFGAKLRAYQQNICLASKRLRVWFPVLSTYAQLNYVTLAATARSGQALQLIEVCAFRLGV